MPYKIVAPHSWMRLDESSNTEVSGASDPGTVLFSKIDLDRYRSAYTKYKQ